MTHQSNNLPVLAFSFFLCCVLVATLAIGFTGNLFKTSLIAYALPVALPIGYGLTYHHFFSPTRRNIAVCLIGSAVLCLLCIASQRIVDMSYDSMMYQQPAVSEILQGQNPLRDKSNLFWLDIYVHGVWMIQASIAASMGALETAKSLYLFWLFITPPVLFYGIRNIHGSLTGWQIAIGILLFANPVFISQFLTHYTDALIYITGITFLGAMLLYGNDAGQNRISTALMVMTLALLISTKLSGVYFGVMLCCCVLVYKYLQDRKLPWGLAGILLATGIVSICIVNYKPYITNLLEYGWLLPMSGEELTASLRPANLDNMWPITRFFYSLFSIMGGENREIAVLKWPWLIAAREWQIGSVDPKSGGFGPLFALSMVLCFLWLGWHQCCEYWNKKSFQPIFLARSVAVIALLVFAFSILFPQSWWARYSPFVYAVPLLLLLSAAPRLPSRLQSIARLLIIGVFCFNNLIVLHATYDDRMVTARQYDDTIKHLQSVQGEIYLVPELRERFPRYGQAPFTIQRRLQEKNISASIKVHATCKYEDAIWGGIRICH